MSAFHDNALIGASGSQGYTISRSVRLRSSASAYFNRTPGSTTNRQIMTWSGWVKRGAITTSDYKVLFSAGSGDGTICALFFNTDNTLYTLNYNGGYNWQLVTTQKFPDTTSWYHIVMAVDTTLAATRDRIKLYVNGTQITISGLTGTNVGNMNGNTFSVRRYFSGRRLRRRLETT